MAFGVQDASNFADRAMRTFQLLKRLKRHHQIERLGSKRQVVEIAPEIGRWMILTGPLERPGREVHSDILVPPVDKPP
jgi:hypothetical protein